MGVAPVGGAGHRRRAAARADRARRRRRLLARGPGVGRRAQRAGAGLAPERRRSMSRRRLSTCARRVHEYGGAAYAVHRGAIYASNFADQRLYDIAPGRPPARADTRRLLLRAVPGRRRPPAADLRARGSHQGRRAAAGGDRGRAARRGGARRPGSCWRRAPISTPTPALSPDGRRLAWLQWRHPNMPWDGTELYVADLDARRPAADAGARGRRSRRVGVPAVVVARRRRCYFVSDRTGWWNLYRQRGGVVRGAARAWTPSSASRSGCFGTSHLRVRVGADASSSPTRSRAAGAWRCCHSSRGGVEPLDLTLDPLDAVVANSARRLLRRRLGHRGAGHHAGDASAPAKPRS